MLSKKIENLKQFIAILTIGSVINQSGNFLFRIIALLILKNNNYGLFSITIITFNIFLPFSSFVLHSLLTRDIRKAENEYEITKIFQNYIICYIITSSFNFIIFFLVGLYFLNFLGIFLIIFLSLNLVFNAFSEFFIGLSRGYGMPIKSIIISSVNGLLRGLLAFFSLFFIFFQYLGSFILFFGLGYLGSFLVGISLYNSKIKKYLFNSNLNLIEIDKIKENIKNSSLLLFDNFITRFNLWLSTFIALLILNDLSFKIFDLSLMMIVVVKFLGDSLNIATNSNRNLGRFNVNFKKKIKYLITLVFLNIFIEFFLFFTNLDIIILGVIFGDIPIESHFFLRVVLFIPIPLIIAAYFHGRAQNFGKYSYCAMAKIFGLMGSVIIYLPAIIFKLADLLIIGLILESVITSLVLIIFEIYK